LVVAVVALLPWLVVQAAVPAVVRYGGDRDFPPFEYLDDQGNARGFQIDLLRELAAAGGFKVSIRLDDYAVIEREFRDGNLDAIAMTRTRSRGNWASFARSHATPVLAVYRREAERVPTSLHDLAGHVLALEDSEPMRETAALSLAGDEYRLLWAATPLNALQAVAERRADFALVPVAYGDRIVAAGAVDGLEASDLGLRLQAYAFAINPQNAELLLRFDQALAELERSGRLEALRVQWLASHRGVGERIDLEQRVARKRMLIAGLAVAAGAAIALLAWALRRRGRRVRAERARRIDAERRLQVAEERLAATFDRHPDPIAITDQARRILDVNDALCRLLGESKETLLGRTLDALPHWDVESGVPVLRALLVDDAPREGAPVRLRNGSGGQRECVASATVHAQGPTTHRLLILRDVTEQLRASAELREEYDVLSKSAAEQARALALARAQLAEADQQLQEMTTSLSHELRAPLRQALGFTGLLRDELRQGHVAEATRYADEIDGSTQRLNGMVEALIGLARAGHGDLARSAVDMASLVHGAWKTVTAGDPGRQVTLLVSKLPQVSADPRLMLVVWQNLLANAFKFTAAASNARVGVDSFVENGRAWFRVADNGAGFAPSQAERLFQAFSRLAGHREYSGVGLGLAIVRRIVVRHGGSVRARGERGVGAILEFTVDP
jgi:PAS domain S-box-containing protein